MTRILLLFTLLTTITAASAAAPQIHAQEAPQAPFDEALVFEWWDDGIITPEEADEILSRLEEGNYDEACLLAEVYAQEPCTQPKPKSPRKKKSKTTKTAQSPKPAQESPAIIPHGRITWKSQYDSDGRLKKHREELLVQFYYFKLRLGSQELLTYQRDGFESHFGQISTSELRSHMPLDTLWGAALFYPIGKFHAGALLDTSKAFHLQFGFSADRHNKIATSFWRFPDAHAIALQASTSLGQISAWYQLGQSRPLVKLQLQNEKQRLSWKTTAYIHGDSVPQGLNLSKGITENWLWASQTVNVKWPEMQNTAISARIRILSPTSKDSVSARIKMSLASGPKRLRPGLSVTCIEASENCKSTEWKSNIESTWEQFSFKASAKVRHENSRTKPPRIELSAKYTPMRSFAKLILSVPEANPSKAISVQNEIKLVSDWLDCDFVFAFKKNRTRPFMPNYAHLNVSLKF